MPFAEEGERGVKADGSAEIRPRPATNIEKEFDDDASETNNAQFSQRTLPPAQPQYILRGHASQIHAVAFLRRHSRLLTGDADGWVVVWNLATRRPVAVWRAHDGPILKLMEWTSNRIITHGRDSTLRVWQLRPTDESACCKILPIDDSTSSRTPPTILHSLSVNTLNFCGFAFLREWHNVFSYGDIASGAINFANSVYVAVPSSKESSIDIYRLPTERVLSTCPPPRLPSRSNASTSIAVTGIGMVMAIELLYYPSSRRLLLIAGYESGYVCMHELNPHSRTWSQVYLSQPHSEPILSLCVAPKTGFFYTSSADDIIAQHPLPTASPTASLSVATTAPKKIIHTKHSGQQSLTIRDDEQILATAGWDNRVRVYATKSLQELAVLKWHKEGCYAVAFAETLPTPSASSNAAANESENSNDKAGNVITASARREAKTQATHWVAAGSKDGKVSLWEIY
ncbi:WD40 repeat-like protein [Rhizodiscina lignyota]|uniref:ASTRA-associated protein 1 n=1 Tax=Rhizodiscina lignyota TaxID=1504668 RepID=A0A9P4MDL5_9PEZI|nr:WD40 repeat-like protein [Rhizodiscina lignyota]